MYVANELKFGEKKDCINKLRLPIYIYKIMKSHKFQERLPNFEKVFTLSPKIFILYT